MRTGRHGRRLSRAPLALTTLVLGTGTLLGATVGQPAALADISPTASITPASVAVTSVTGFSLAVRNDQLNPLPLGSAAISVPAGFTVSGSLAATVTGLPTSSAKTWSASQTGSTICLTAASAASDLQYGETVTLALTAHAPAVPGTGTWSTQPYIDPSCSTLDGTFPYTGSQPQVSVVPVQLVYTVAPSTTQGGSAIRPVVTVTATGPGGGTVTGFSGYPVTLQPGTSTPTPSGNTATASSGVATFPSLTFSATQLGFSYTLQPTTTVPYTSSPSAAFDIVQSLTNCAAGTSCTSGTVSGTSTTVDVTAGSATTSDQLEVSVGVGAVPSCVVTGQVAHFSVANRSKSVTMTLNKSTVNATPNNGASFYNVCFAAPQPFTTASGATATYDAADGLYDGDLPMCGTVAVAPCVQSINKNTANEVATFIAPAGDPISGWG